MSCDCSRCQRGRQISTLRKLQPERCVRSRTKKYPKLSKKIWEDRIKSQEKIVAMHQKWLEKARDRKMEMGPKWRPGWGDPAMYQRWLDGALKKLERVKAQAEKASGK